jgi:RHS repeat-associated protein
MIINCSSIFYCQNRGIELSYRFSFNGMEKDDEVKGVGNSLDFGARIYDPRLGRWLSLDPIAQKYPFASPYNFALNTPIQAKDPDGKRVYFIAGAGNDIDGWNYKQRFKQIFESKGIKDVRTISASHGKMGDVLFTDAYKNYSEIKGTTTKVTSEMIQATVNAIVNDLAAKPLGEGEQLNLAGYSYGRVLQAHVAIALADKGIKVDNLSLIGSPIADDSELMGTLKKYKTEGKIGEIQRVDIEGDQLSNPSSEWEYIKGGATSSPLGQGDDAEHFDLARPGKAADKKIGEAADKLKKEGVK